MTCKMTKTQQRDFENLIVKFNNARIDIENFLDNIKGDWESKLEDKPESYSESQAGQDASERLSILEGWLDEIANDFEPDTSEVS